MKCKRIFNAKVTGHSIDPEAKDYKSWLDKRRTEEFCFAAGSFEEALSICRGWCKDSITVDELAGHNTEYVQASFVTIESLVCSVGFIHV